MIRKLARSFFRVNKPTVQAFGKSAGIGLCRTEAFQPFLSADALSHGPQFFDAIARNPAAFELYRKMVPYFALNRFKGVGCFVVVDASYHPDARMFELTVLEPAGLFRRTVTLEDFVPTTWDDFMRVQRFNVPPFAEVDQEMVFTGAHSPDFYLFPKSAEWNAEGASHPHLDFRTLFDETRWVDDQIRPY